MNLSSRTDQHLRPVEREADPGDQKPKESRGGRGRRRRKRAEEGGGEERVGDDHDDPQPQVAPRSQGGIGLGPGAVAPQQKLLKYLPTKVKR